MDEMALSYARVYESTLTRPSPPPPLRYIDALPIKCVYTSTRLLQEMNIIYKYMYIYYNTARQAGRAAKQTSPLPAARPSTAQLGFRANDRSLLQTTTTTANHYLLFLLLLFKSVVIYHLSRIIR
jgi:hypothetical protein